MSLSHQYLGADGSIALGDTVEIVLTLTRGGTAYEPTLSAAEATFKREIDDADADALITKTLGSGVVINGSTLTVTLDPGDQSSLTDTTTLWWSVRIRETSGVETTVGDGLLVLTLKAGRTL